MAVLHVNIPSFPIEVERLVDPRLKAKPVAIVASESRRAPLLYVSPEAHAQGIRKGMFQKAMDWMLKCPKLMERPIVIQGAKARLGRPPEQVLEII